VGIRYDDEDLCRLANEALATVEQAQRDEMWNTAAEKAPA
jgi:hypothetical protein